MSFEVRISGDALRNLDRMIEKAPLIFAPAVNRTALEIESETKKALTDADPYPAVDTGRLRASYRTVMINALAARVGTDVQYAPYIEHGTSPHFPPLAPIVAWVKRKFRIRDEKRAKGVAFRIATRISERGTPERPHLMPAFERGKRRLLARIRVAAKNLRP